MRDLRKEINSRLYERVSSPLLSTFILSWGVTNWKFFYVTLFESHNSLGASKISYIAQTLYPHCEWATYLKLIAIPILSTYLIIWHLPVLINNAYNVSEKFKNERRQERLRILSDSKIDGKKFLELNEQFKRKEREYIEVFSEKEIVDNKFKELAKERDQLNATISQIESQKNQIGTELGVIRTERDSLKSIIEHTRHNLSDIFKGKWICRFILREGRWESEYFIIRENYKYFKSEMSNPNEEKYIFDIDRVVYDKGSGKLTFRKIHLLDDRPPTTVDLQRSNETFFTGFENNNIPVEYELFR